MIGAPLLKSPGVKLWLNLVGNLSVCQMLDTGGDLPLVGWAALVSNNIRDVFPMTPMRKLLKLWAMPPARVPIASTFCAWESCASSFFSKDTCLGCMVCVWERLKKFE